MYVSLAEVTIFVIVSSVTQLHANGIVRFVSTTTTQTDDTYRFQCLERLAALLFNCSLARASQNGLAVHLTDASLIASPSPVTSSWLGV